MQTLTGAIPQPEPTKVKGTVLTKKQAALKVHMSFAVSFDEFQTQYPQQLVFRYNVS